TAGERVRDGSRRIPGVHALRRDDPEVAAGELRRLGRRPDAADELARARESEAALVDRADVSRVEVVRPDLDAGELGQVRRKERPDGTAADHGDPHEA